MSQLVVSPMTAVDSIPLGRRIKEIMKEKGSFYSVTGMSSRIGINRETFRMMLNGKREIYTFELDLIAKDLKVSPERILQEDIRGKTEKSDEYRRHALNLQEALELALEIESVALGISERCMALHKLGHSYFLLHRYEDSQNTLYKAQKYALEIMEEYEENDLYYRILFNLIDTFTARKDYVTASQMLEKIEPVFEMPPSRKVALCYLHANIKESMNDLLNARVLAYESLNYAIQSEDINIIARAQINVAHFENTLQNFRVAKKYLEKACSSLNTEDKTYFIARKELIKSLIKLQEYERAEKEASILSDELEKVDFHEMKGKLLQLRLDIFLSKMNSVSSMGASTMIFYNTVIPEYCNFRCVDKDEKLRMVNNELKRLVFDIGSL